MKIISSLPGKGKTIELLFWLRDIDRPKNEKRFIVAFSEREAYRLCDLGIPPEFIITFQELLNRTIELPIGSKVAFDNIDIMLRQLLGYKSEIEILTITDSKTDLQILE